MDRRDFLRLTGLGVGTLMVPVLGGPRALLGATTPVPSADKKALADAALNAARAKGASYADVRVGRYLNQFVFTREDKVQNLVNTESYGVGVRVIADGTWGFAATSTVTKDGVARAAEQAVAIAKANAKIQQEPVRLAPLKGHGEVSWRTPIQKNAFDIPMKEKVDLLMAVNAAAMGAGAKFVNSALFLVNEQKYFASTDGSWIDQDVHRLWPNFTATGVDEASGKFQNRDALSAPVGMGWEYLGTGGAVSDIVTPVYGDRYDMLADAKAAGAQVKEKLAAKPVEPGKYDLVLDPTHLYLTIHESVGHPLELDRVLGYEANYAGTSFATLDKWQSKSFKYGSDKVTLFADKTQPGSLGAVGYDDEGVKTKRWDLVRDGVLVDYQKIRDQAHILAQTESDGCCYADSWASVQFQRMPNVSLAAGKAQLTPQQMIADVEKGILIIGDGSYSIDQQRYNFQFGGQLFYEIKDGKVTGMLRDVAYQANTQEFWNSCVATCDERDYRLGGSFFDGKGQPGQISAVSHGSATTRFNGINVINTERKIWGHPTMTILSREEAQAILKKVMAFSKAETCQANLGGGTTGNIRYARNTVTTSGRTENVQLGVTSSYGKKQGTATINELDDAALERVVRRSEELAQLAPENPELMPPLEPQQYMDVSGWFDATANITPEMRAQAAAASINPSREKKMVAAGFLQDNASFNALMNSKGLFGYYPATGVNFTITVRSEDGSGSGYATADANDIGQIDTGRTSAVAIDKAVRSMGARAIEPGKYTVILEPAASINLLQYMGFGFDARQADEGRSFLSKPGGGSKKGEKIMDERVSIWSDPADPRVPVAPFAGDGRPRKKTMWIENGVVKSLYTSRYWAQKTGIEDLPFPANLVMAGGTATTDELVRDTKRGLLVTRTWYIRMVDPQTVLVTGLTRDGLFFIEDGKLTFPVKNMRFNESPVIMLNNLDALGKPERFGDGDEGGTGNMIPPMRIRDFTFTSLSDAV